MTKTIAAEKSTKSSPEINRVLPEDRLAHEWYRFVLSYPPHLVRNYLRMFNASPSTTVLDPFCGTGTTLVEAKRNGIPSVGIEGNALAKFATSVKLDWSPNPDKLLTTAFAVAQEVKHRLEADGVPDTTALDVCSDFGFKLRQLSAEAEALLLQNSISPKPLHKVLVLRDAVDNVSVDCREHILLALAKALVSGVSNLKFGPEVGIGKPKPDAAVVDIWLREVARMAEDLTKLQGAYAHPARSIIHHGDAREVSNLLGPRSVDIVITSPPYPNEKDYTRTTRLESVILGFLRTKQDLRDLKKVLVRSNTRGVYIDDTDDQIVADHEEIQTIATMIEQRRMELNKTSGFERLYARVTKLYFGGMVRHLRELQQVLKPGARLAYVVGDQASYLRIMIRTGQILKDLAVSLGYECERIDLFRTRLSTATKEQLREEVVVLKWRG